MPGRWRTAGYEALPCSCLKPMSPSLPLIVFFLQVVHTYHERQTVLKCGVHAVNNLLGERVFCSADFDAFSRSVSPESMWTRLGVGNYDVNVLEVALKSRGLVVSWFDRRKTFAEADATHCQGLMLNRLSDAWLSSVVGMRHWVSVRRHEEQWYNCDSMLKEAELLSGTQLEELVREALEQHDGYCLLITKETLR